MSPSNSNDWQEEIQEVDQVVRSIGKIEPDFRRYTVAFNMNKENSIKYSLM